MSQSELAVSYAALILADDNVDVTVSNQNLGKKVRLKLTNY